MGLLIVTDPTIALLGLGAMGTRMAQRLINTQYPLIVYNRTPDKALSLISQGAKLASSPKEAAKQADIVISIVTDIHASKAIWLDADQGAVHGLKEHAIAIESSTVTADWMRELATAITGQDAAVLDAPVIGSRPQADAGQLTFLVGGEAQTLEKVRDVLLLMGTNIHHVGKMGQGMAMKLAVNALLSLQISGLAEQLISLKSQGLSYEESMNCLSDLPIMSPAMKGAGALMSQGNHQPLFPLELAAKDLRYVMANPSAEMPLSTAVLNLYQDVIAQGYGTQNFTSVAKHFEGMAK